MIELYVCRMRTKYSLSIKQAHHLLSTILIAMVCKVITTNDIYYNNGSSIEVGGISAF